MKNRYTFSILLFFSITLILLDSIFCQVTFTDIAPTVGVNDPGNGQGVAFIDVNNDGYLDIFLVNNGQSNKLFLNNAGTTFTDATTTLGLGNSGNGRGAAV